MGLDTSAHPVDEALFRDRLVPFVRTGKPIDDLIARAARMAVASSRAATWRFSAQNFSWKVREAQEAVVPTVTERYSEPARKQNFLESIFGIKPPMREKTFTRPERVPGLAAVDNDLTSFGRPFFMPVEGTERVLALYERYLQAEKGGEAAVDAIAREMVAELSANALKFPAGTRPAVIEATKKNAAVRGAHSAGTRGRRRPGVDGGAAREAAEARERDVALRLSQPQIRQAIAQ